MIRYKPNVAEPQPTCPTVEVPYRSYHGCTILYKKMKCALVRIRFDRVLSFIVLFAEGRDIKFFMDSSGVLGLRLKAPLELNLEAALNKIEFSF